MLESVGPSVACVRKRAASFALTRGGGGGGGLDELLLPPPLQPDSAATKSAETDRADKTGPRCMRILLHPSNIDVVFSMNCAAILSRCKRARQAAKHRVTC